MLGNIFVLIEKEMHKMTRQEMIDRGASEDEVDLLCPNCGSSVLRLSCGIFDFACLGFYDPSDKSFHKGGECCDTISALRKRVVILESENKQLEKDVDNAYGH